MNPLRSGHLPMAPARDARLDLNASMRRLLAATLAAALLLHPGSNVLPVKFGPLTPLHATLAVAAILMIARSVARPPRVLRLGAVDLGFLGLGAAVVASYAGMFVEQREAAGAGIIVAAGVAAIASAGLSYRLFATWVRARAQLRSLIGLVIDLTTLNAAINLAAWLLTTGGVVARYNFEPPIVGSQGISTLLSTIGFLLALASRRFDARGGGRFRIGLIFRLVILAGSVAVIVTRQGQLTFLVVVLAFLGLDRPGRRERSRHGTAVGVVATIVLAVLVIAVSGRDVVASYVDLARGDSAAVFGRLAIIGAAFDVFRDHPLTGIGYGNFGPGHQIVFYVSGLPVRLASAHNGLASLAAETGLVGLAAFAALSTATLVSLLRARRRLRARDGALHALATAVLVLFVAELLSMVASNSILMPVPTEPIYVQVGCLYWSLAGMVRAAVHGEGPPWCADSAVEVAA